MGDQARTEAHQNIRDLLVEKTLRVFEEDYRKKHGKAPAKQAVESMRTTLMASQAIEREVDYQASLIAGFEEREGILDAGAMLLWGVSGSLIAALVWDCRIAVPAVLIVALVAAGCVQFRGPLLTRMNMAGLSTIAVAVCLVAIGLAYRAEFSSAVTKWIPSLRPSSQTDERLVPLQSQQD